jgi:hypothetical protein
MKIRNLIAAVAMAVTSLTTHAAITDGRFGTGQMFDVQYYWSGTTLNVSGLTRIYSSSGQLTTQDYTDMQNNGQYFGFFDSTTAGQYGLAIYNSNGTVARTLHTTGTITAVGPDAIFYLGSGFYGTVISTTQGYSFGSSAMFTSMDTTVTSADLTSYTYGTTTPLAAGQTASAQPIVVSTAPGTPIVTTSTVSSSSTTVNSVTYASVQDTKNLVITKTTTPVTTTTTVTRTSTTPTTVTTYSDNTTTATNGSTTDVDSTSNNTTVGNATTVDYSTRIDQLTTLDSINRRLNQANESNILSRQTVKDSKFAGDHASTVYIIGQGQRSNTYDGYSYRTSRYGIGADYRASQDLIIGWQFVRSNTKLLGIESGGGLDKDQFSLHSAYTQHGWIVLNEVGMSRNRFSSYHTLSELSASNSAVAKGRDLWTNARVYTPDVNGLRPFVGARWERNQRNGAVESGTVLTSAVHSAIKQTNLSSEAGVRYELPMSSGKFYTELGRTSQQLTRAHLGISTVVDNKTAVRIQAGTERQHGAVNRMIQADLRWLF